MEFVKTVGPLGMIFIMFSLGLNLSYKDFFEVLKKPRNLIVALICQMIMLPLIGIIIISFFPMQAEFQLGVFLLLILPSAVMSNYATKLVKGNVALSITITSICGLISFITIPMFLKIYAAFFSSVEFDLNLLKFSVRMFLFIALPTFVGILVRGNFRRFSEQNNLKFDRAALALFIIILLVAIFTEQGNLGGYFADAGAIAFVVIISVSIPRLLTTSGFIFCIFSKTPDPTNPPLKLTSELFSLFIPIAELRALTPLSPTMASVPWFILPVRTKSAKALLSKLPSVIDLLIFFILELPIPATLFAITSVISNPTIPAEPKLATIPGVNPVLVINFSIPSSFSSLAFNFVIAPKVSAIALLVINV